MKYKLMVGLLILVLATLITNLLYNQKKDKLNNNAVEVTKKAEYCIFIEIEDKTLYLLQDGKCIKKYPIASGKPYWPSPLGCWEITDKGNWGEGFGGRWLGLNVPWGRYGIHGTLINESIGSDESHGCIRMFNRDVLELFSLVSVGTPVVIVNGSFGPFGTGFQNIEPGDRGADVLAIQKRLKDLGYLNGYIAGLYDDNLKFAIHKFQKDNGLYVKNTITKEDYLKMEFKDFE